MKIALLSPAGAMHRYDGLFSKNLHYAPLTLTLLAALVPAELNAHVSIYDETAGRIPLDLDADVVGITCITGTGARAYKFADYFRKRGATVVLGGPHPSLVPREAKEHADSVVIGLADRTWPRLLRDCRDGCLQAYYADDTPSAANRPIPRRELLNKRKYITLNTVEAIRGCHRNCSFCAYPRAFGSCVTARPVEDVIAEIKRLRGKPVIFPDVNLLSDIPYAKALFNAMIPLKKWWFGLTTSDVALDDDLVRLFKKSGCKGLLIGFESVNEGSQKEMRKGFNEPPKYKDLMDKLHRNGIMVMGCFAFGSDEDGPDVFDRTVKLADEVKIDLPRYAIFTPFPQTEYYRRLEEENRIAERDWALYDVEHCVFVPKNMTKEQLEDGIRKAWKGSYSIRSMIRRFDLRKPRILLFAFIYVLANIGYRRYAKKFDIFDAAIMTDNSDIPDGIPE
ncbi:MAG: B12-binding domain-containing radical SAM protein [Clostridiales Family XIII bacterium]|jgi:radical SAM superfamily enzyme YgiQ (UPF0313 family)|nr:B12-binding domain-containing radical SAM protein [Clostridiales Family XIII bacterium]